MREVAVLPAALPTLSAAFTLCNAGVEYSNERVSARHCNVCASRANPSERRPGHAELLVW